MVASLQWGRPVASGHEAVQIGPMRLAGNFERASPSAGVVVFAHGSGSSRLSPRNRYVAEVLHGHGLGTLLFDLLTDAESIDRRLVFDIPLLAERLEQALDWLGSRQESGRPRVGLFGASTGAAAALCAAAERPAEVAAVVSRGGRPDLAGAALGHVEAPTLLIVGALDAEVLELNREAARRMHCKTQLEIVPGATHLFEEPGALDAVANLAGAWFAHHLAAAEGP